MPNLRYRRTGTREGRRRARQGLSSVLIALLLLVVGACGNDGETLDAQEVPAPPGSGSTALETGEQPHMLINASVADNHSDACLGAKEITVEPDDLLHFCVQVANLGEIPLTDVEISSDDPNLDMGSLLAVSGDFEKIDPEGFLIATLAEPVGDGILSGQMAQDGIDIWLRATATPVSADDAELEEILANAMVFVQVEEADSPAGFASTVGSGVDTLLTGINRFPLMLSLIVIVVPFVGVVTGLGLLVKQRRENWLSQ